MIVHTVSELVGKTPIVKLSRKGRENMATIFVKLEFQNPGGSVKDRIALSMIEALEEEKKITENTLLVEPTSGNTGIGLAMIAAAKGYQLTLVMPDTMTIERRKILKAYGADLVLTEGSKGMKGAIEKANEIVSTHANAIIPGQFINPANPAVHYKTTGPEIWNDLNGQVDAFIAGVGTGGTITGAGRYLREKNPSIQLVAVEPSDSPVLSGGEPGPHKIQGIGAGFVPEIMDTRLLSRIVQITTEEAIETARKVAREEGLLLGISSGAAIAAAFKIAKNMDPNQHLVVMTASNGERYLSTPLYDID
ncbi:cysteine synthase A [Tindallia californiensis]|uniref:Cysteine synthase n=1 Tax=Tindallia californiensis TaxID=159292 RepID=A0A1H3MJP7_9FIRM|nr:cysteine synthase A [Tindallia californiensis]SDY76942.1 cysteine synthase A [Tindallia californiensis]